MTRMLEAEFSRILCLRRDFRATSGYIRRRQKEEAIISPLEVLASKEFCCRGMAALHYRISSAWRHYFRRDRVLFNRATGRCTLNISTIS